MTLCRVIYLFDLIKDINLKYFVVITFVLLELFPESVGKNLRFLIKFQTLKHHCACIRKVRFFFISHHLFYIHFLLDLNTRSALQVNVL